MIRKYHNHTLQTNPRHRKEEPQNIYHDIRKTITAKQSAFKKALFISKYDYAYKIFSSALILLCFVINHMTGSIFPNL